MIGQGFNSGHMVVIIYDYELLFMMVIIQKVTPPPVRGQVPPGAAAGDGLPRTDLGVVPLHAGHAHLRPRRGHRRSAHSITTTTTTPQHPNPTSIKTLVACRSTLVLWRPFLHLGTVVKSSRMAWMIFNVQSMPSVLLNTFSDYIML